MTGLSTGTISATDYATIAYRAATGVQRWVKRYNGPGNSFDSAQSMAVSPSGGTVFVTGRSTGVPPSYFFGLDYATVAYRS